MVPNRYSLSGKEHGLKNVLIRAVFLAVLATIISFDTQPRRLPDSTSRPAFDTRAVEPVKRFMAAHSDSVLTVLNGNLWMLPAGLAVDKEERLDRFIALARYLKPHVITLQEVWTWDLVAYLTMQLPAFRVAASGRNGLFNGGGLVTLLRVPGDVTTFTAFPVDEETSLLERQAGKGYLTVRLKTPLFEANIINTHLYAPTSEQEQAIAAAQFSLLKQLDPNDYLFIVGDLNLTQRAFGRLNDAFFLTERDTAHTLEPANPYTRRGVNAYKKPRSYKLDRLLMPQAHGAHFTLHAMRLRDPLVSDHYLMAYRIERRAKKE